MKKRLSGSILLGFMAMSVMAQISNTLSPYSQFGLGVMADQSQSFNRGMNGLAIGFRDSKQVNMLNPASYSAVDSLTMVFDVGISGQLTNFKEFGTKINAKTADFDYATALFRVLPKVGVSLGVVPYTNIGYNYYSSQYIGTSDTYTTESHSGDGGFSQAYLGVGWELLKGVSIGANVSYLWGNYNRQISVASSDSYVNTITKTYSATVNSYKLDFGVQWQQRLDAKNILTIGATAGIGHKLGADANLVIINTNGQTGVTTTTTDSVPNGLSIPYTFGAGVTLLHNNSLTVGADYSLQRWGVLDFPQVNERTQHYVATSGMLKDRHKVTVGADWIPNALSRRFLSRVHYRMGASYATPYYKIGVLDGPKEWSVSAGFGIPITNSWNNRSSLNISAQWGHVSAANLVTENTFRINIGLTFNERWFAKWKVD